jgi:transcriptional regulator with XRE-family HTH domain
MGVSRTFVSNFELGDVEVTDALLERYAAALAQAKERRPLRATS